MARDELHQPERARPLDDHELAALTRRYVGPGVAALALTGSHARGDAHGHSDIDLLRFMERERATARERYHLDLISGRLVSVSATTLAAKRAELAQPETAIWAVPGLRQARALYDRDGDLAALLAEAHAFLWTPELRRAADAYASDALAGLAEEVHKLLGALERGDESAMLYAALGLQQGLTRAALVARCVLLTSENAYFAEALALDGANSHWRRLLRLVAGFDAPAPGTSPARARGVAALWLYVQAAEMLAGALTVEDCALVAESVGRIRHALREQ
ncbi:MAG TPA: nucleotidyltransferase domain-containing protein [Ktedonobacterales bacterium]